MKEINIFNINIKKRDKKGKNIGHTIGILTSLIAVVFALCIGGLIIALVGVDPIYAYRCMVYGAFGSVNNIAETLIKTTPLLIAGIGLSISFRCNLISVGAEGQMVIGGIFATLAGLYLKGAPPIIVIPVVIIAGFVGGGLFGAIPGILKAKFGTSEIINTIMLNYVAINLLSFLLDSPMREVGSYYPQSGLIDKGYWLPNLISGTRLHMGIVIGIVLVVAYYILMFRLPLGFKIRTVGFSPKAANYAGINVKRNIVIAMVLSGGLAGIAGMSEIFGVHHRLFNDFTVGYGFDAMAVALLGQLHPIGVFISALFFGSLRVGSNAMQHSVQVPISIVNVIQGLTILFILTDKLLRNFIISISKKKKTVIGKEC